MNIFMQTFKKGKRIIAASLGVVTVLAAVIAVALPAESAAALSCHVFTAEAAGYEAGMVYSKTYYVPSWSQCKDINIRNVQNQQVSSDHCATFKVQFFPTWGDPYYGTAKKVCSTGPQGPVVPIATNVKDGTKYRIWYNVENTAWRHTYQIVD